MKINTIAIVGAVIALIGLAFPWWTMNFSLTSGVSVPLGTSFSYSSSIYPYQTTATGYGVTMVGQISLWYAWAAFAFLVVGALLTIAFSLVPKARLALAVSGTLAALSVIVFVVGLQNNLATSSGLSGFGVFSSGSISEFGYIYNYSTYLSVGFWLALAGAIVILIAPLRKPKAAAPTAVPPPAPAQQEQVSTPPS